jgi:hypothetical protein
MSNYVKMVSPKGKAYYPKINHPDQKYNNYQASLILTDADAEDLLEKLKDVYVDECGPKKLATATFPVKKQEDGTWVFKSTSKQKPKIYDSKGKPVLDSTELNIGGGTEMKVSFSATVKQDRSGVTAYLNAVQIINLVEFSSTPFGDEGDGFTASDKEESESDIDEDVAF